MGILFLVNLVAIGGIWLSWPAVIWGVALVAHYMYVKSLSVDDGWADEKAADIFANASDRSHIESIHQRRGGMTSPRRGTRRGGRGAVETPTDTDGHGAG